MQPETTLPKNTNYNDKYNVPTNSYMSKDVSSNYKPSKVETYDTPKT